MDKGHRMTTASIGKQGELFYLDGIIIPTAWNANGSPTQFSLFTFDEREFKLAPATREKNRLPSYSRKNIRVAYRVQSGTDPAASIVPVDFLELDGLKNSDK